MVRDLKLSLHEGYDQYACVSYMSLRLEGGNLFIVKMNIVSILPQILTLKP